MELTQTQKEPNRTPIPTRRPGRISIAMLEVVRNTSATKKSVKAARRPVRTTPAMWKLVPMPTAIEGGPGTYMAGTLRRRIPTSARELVRTPTYRHEEAGPENKREKAAPKIPSWL